MSVKNELGLFFSKLLLLVNVNEFPGYTSGKIEMCNFSTKIEVIVRSKREMKVK